MRIGIFGGSFNPPHKMHEDIAKFFIDQDILDKVIFVPTGSKYKYKTNLVPDIDRYNMVKLITDKNDHFEVSDFELKDNAVYTCETLEHFSYEYPDDEIFFICGLDNLSYIDSWKNAEYILNYFKILVIRRNTDDLDEVLNRLHKYRKNIIVVDKESEDISSTLIRGNLIDDKVRDFLDPDVYKYIKEKELY